MLGHIRLSVSRIPPPRHGGAAALAGAQLGGLFTPNEILFSANRRIQNFRRVNKKRPVGTDRSLFDSMRSHRRCSQWIGIDAVSTGRP